MAIEGLKENLKQGKEIVRELYSFSSQLEAMNRIESGQSYTLDKKEKDLLMSSVLYLTNILKILNNSIPDIINKVGFYKNFSPSAENINAKEMVNVKYYPSEGAGSVSLIISEKDKNDFLNNLSRSRLTINQLKKSYAVEKSSEVYVKPSAYARTSNFFFKNFSNKLVAEGYFKSLNRDLRKINSRFVVSSYVSIIFFTAFIAFLASILLLIVIMFFDISIFYPFISLSEDVFYIKFIKYFWIIFVIPLITGLFAYIYPSSEAKNLGHKLDQELPFVTIHMSAIASSGIEPVSIFYIIVKGGEYRYVGIEFKKIMNLINFHGEDIVGALKKVSLLSPSSKLRELLNGLAVTITSGGDMHKFLEKHAENMLFDYKLERERYTRVSETILDIYISIAIAAPIILIMIFVIIGSTGMMGDLFGLSIDSLNILIIAFIVLLNILFLFLLNLKQPTV